MIETLVLLGVAAFAAGAAGAVLGVGGSVLLIPFMSIGLGLDMKTAIATGLLSVIGTSAGAAAPYLRQGLANVRLGVLLAVGTSSGALAGALVAVDLDSRYLFATFAAATLGVGAYMARAGETARERAWRPAPAPSGRLRLDGQYFDPEDAAFYRYTVARPGTGVLAGVGAGALSGLLGVGGGFVMVPAMTGVMRVPLKPAVATSSMLLGITGAASAAVYLAGGFVDPLLAMAALLGVSGGTRVGIRFMRRTPERTVRLAFAALLVVVAVLMGAQAFAGGAVP
ncbi:MAG TPA: sulfite exporter TauE/SafE family protein [Candidatus Thermoplasmatota archaeon]